MSEELVSTGGAEMGTLGPLASRKTVAGAKLAERIQAGSSGRVSVGVQGAVGGRPGHCDGSSDSSAPEKQRGEGNSKRAMCGGAGGGSSGRGKDIADGRHVNTRIQKYFPGHGTFNGIVTAYYPSHNTYHIRYDDNDDEIISYKSLLRLIENKSASASEVQAVACSALAEDVEDLSGEGSSKQAAQGETARKCEHNRQRCECKDCGGGSICEHNRRRSRCTECGGGSICEHNRERSRCKDCGGGSICQHKRRRSTCKECAGASICEHKRIRGECKSGKEEVQAMRRVENLPAQSGKEQVQGVRGWGHLQARSDQEQVQGVQNRQGDTSMSPIACGQLSLSLSLPPSLCLPLSLSLLSLSLSLSPSLPPSLWLDVYRP